jgi:AcrR family transcriptional regulator
MDAMSEDTVENAVVAAPGRPRDQRIDRAVLAATNELLERDGYGQLTIAAIAERAGTTKTAIYRRWPTKAHLVHEAAFPDPGRPSSQAAGDGGLADELRAMLTAGIEVLGRPATRAAIPGLLVALGSDSVLHDELRQRFAGGSFQHLIDAIDAGIVAGDVRPDTDASLLLDLISGAAFLATATHLPEDIDDDWVDQVVALLMRGIRP